jgi:thymidylate kinase
LVEKVQPAQLFKFPDRSYPFGELIYRHLAEEWWVDSKDSMEEVHRQNAMVFQALQMTNRLEVLPALRAALKDRHVVCDRYWQSGYAYGVADGLDGDHLANLLSIMPEPDLNILFHMPVERARERRPTSRDRYENQGTGFMQRVQKNYLHLWGSHVGDLRWVIVNADQPPENVLTDVLLAVKGVTRG